MIHQIIKRDGRLEPFDKGKIESAISRANQEVASHEQLSEEAIKEIVGNVCFHLQFMERIPEVEDVQEIVEVELMKYEAYSVAKTYIRYRYKHMLDRAKQADLMKKIGEKIQATNIENQNANVDEMSFGGRKGEADAALMKQWALDNCISKMARENHENNEVYIHDLDNYAVGMHNCFDSSTRFVTKNGVKRFGDCTDGQVVQVVDMHGNWKNATVHCYGKQQMYDLTFRSGQTTKQITCTRNHRWVLSDGTITDHIEVGDAILIAPKIKQEYQFDSQMWCLGFVLGDGCDFYMRSKDRSRITNSGMQVRLCGSKTRYVDVFCSAGWSVRQNHKNGDITVFTRGNGAVKQAFLDNKIWKILSYNDLCNLFEGYICADGHVKDNGSVCVSTSDVRLKQMIEDISSTRGYYLWSESEKYNDTNFKEGRTLYDLYLVKSQSNRWILTDIRKADRGEKGYMVAWCVDEPTTHTFTLDGCMVTGNCLSIPFDDLLANGFNTRQTDVRPAQSVNTAFQLLAVLFQLQSLQQFGGVSATHLDWTMVPYVRKSFYKHYIDGLRYVSRCGDDDIDRTKKWIEDHPGLGIDDKYFAIPVQANRYAMDMTVKEVNQAVEGMYHNLNTLQSRSGNQLPFTSINYGTCTLPEGRMITKALLECSIKGIGKLHKTPIFPCGIFQSAEGINRKPGDPNYDLFQLALKSTSLRLYPNYANVNWSGNEGYDPTDPRTYFSTMGCRTANGWDINGFGQLKDGRGNICPVTIILPTLAMQVKERLNGCDYSDSRDSVAAFLNLLNEKIYEAKDMLIERYKWICSQPSESAKFMYENGLMAGYDGKTTESALKHGTLAMGQLGLAEALEILIGCNHTTEEGMRLAKEIERLFKKRCAEFKNEYKLNFGVYYSPAENLCYTAMQKFRDKYGVIRNVSDHDFFTNSMHIPVWEKVGVFEKIDLESQLTGYSSAGCITYVELESSVKNNLKALETVVLYAMEHDIPYFAVNVPNDTCLDCGFTDEFNDTCPQCGSHHIQHLRRVTGYLTGNYKTAFNKGKQQEVEMRVKHSQNGGHYEVQRD